MVTVFIIAPVGNAVSSTPTDEHIRVEVFTTTDLQFFESTTAIENSVSDADLQVYELNGIQLAEAELSKNLTTDAAQSKRILLQRIQILDEQTRTRMQRSAIGIAKAMQYGINRYPAIVFDGQTVVYGVTSLKTALVQYQSWLAGNKL